MSTDRFRIGLKGLAKQCLRGVQELTGVLLQDGVFEAWTASAVTVQPNVAVEPVSGLPYADRMIETTALIGHSLTSPNIAFVLGNTYEFSVEAKYETAAFIQLLFGGAAFGSNAWADFDVQNGQATFVAAAATAKVTALPDGWYRISITAVCTASASTVGVIFGANSGTMTRALSYTGSTASKRLLANAQVIVQ